MTKLMKVIFVILFALVLFPAANAALNTSLTHCWNLDSSGEDEVGALDMTAQNGATYTTSNQKLGSAAADCDGVDDYFTFSDTGDFADNFTVNFWQYANLSSTVETPVSFTGEYKFWFNHSSSGDDANINDDVSTWHYLISDEPDNGTWRMITLTRDDTGNMLYLYIDGQLNDTDTLTAELGATAKENSICAFNNPWGTWEQYFNGSIDDVAIWTRVLDSDEIEQIYNNSYGTPCPDFLLPEPPDTNLTGNFTVGDCPMDSTPQVLMLFLMAGIMLAMVMISELIIKIDFFTLLAGIGITVLGMFFLGCSMVIALVIIGFGLMLVAYAAFLKKY